MAYNSDGYIMIDFAEVDFRRTNQTIEGLFKRCVDVIGTNKFILVINANGRTPLPATCSFTNNQYVIDTCIYLFAISSNDNLFIRRNDVPASDIIDDSSISVDKTWSSNKIDTELDTKADTSALADYQPLLTPVSPISIEDNNISVDLSSKQDVLTAGNNISIDNNVISATCVKSFKYTGTGTSANHRIDLPTDCKMILLITPGSDTPTGTYDYTRLENCLPIMPAGSHIECRMGTYVNNGTAINTAAFHIDFFEGYIQTTAASNSTALNLNVNNVEYTVYYI